MYVKCDPWYYLDFDLQAVVGLQIKSSYAIIVICSLKLDKQNTD